MTRSLGILLPVLVLVLLVWLMVGCIYVPSLNQVNYARGHQDFRPFLGASGDGRPIAVGHVARGQVIALLGTPALASTDGSAIGYVFEERHGYWVWPQCVAAGTAQYTVHALRLDFDGQGVLKGCRTAVRDCLVAPGDVGLWRASPEVCESELLEDLEELNRVGPSLSERGGRPLFDDKNNFQTVWTAADPAAVGPAAVGR
jgi:hypothetical protein